MTESPVARRPVAAYRWKVEPLRFVHERTRAQVTTIPDGVVCRRGKLVVVSTLDVAELPDGSGEVGPQWHVSISLDDVRRPRRATDEECERTSRGARGTSGSQSIRRGAWSASARRPTR